MIRINWIQGQCDECGETMPVPNVSIGHEECKACRHIKALEKIAYLLEQRLGWD